MEMQGTQKGQNNLENTTAEKLKPQPKCPSTDEWINKTQNNYRKKDGKPLANVTMVKDLYKIEEKKEKLFGQPFVYYTGTNNNIIFALKKRLFKDLIG